MLSPYASSFWLDISSSDLGGPLSLSVALGVVPCHFYNWLWIAHHGTNFLHKKQRAHAPFLIPSSISFIPPFTPAQNFTNRRRS
ncbi:MAG: hypothetical protein ACREIC_32475, partial [Limisphaerales bacterium]